ncbi:MAG: 5'-nucleotidase C-terminal domain-containing protein [Oscillospiraceae bacterium]|jgi:hypothetical protein
MRKRKSLNKAVCFFLTALIIAAIPAGTASADNLGTVDTLLAGTGEPGACGKEMPLGDAAADALRAYTGADIGLVPGVAIQGNLQGGELTLEEINRVFPADFSIGVAEMTPADLYRVLEHSVSHFVVGENDSVDYELSRFDGFLQVSGIIFRYDVAAPVGERILDLALAGGTKLNRDDASSILTVATFTDLLESRWGYPAFAYVTSDRSFTGTFMWYVRQEGTLMMPEGERMTMIGTRDRSFLNGMGTSVVWFILCVAVFYGVYSVTLGSSPAWKALKDRVKPETEAEKKSALNRLLHK